MRFFVFLKLIYRKSQVYWLEQSNTVEILKYAIYRRTGIPIGHQRLKLGGGRLEDHRMLSEYHIREDSMIFLTRVRGSDPSRSDTKWSTTMTPLELGHYGYLLGKVTELFLQEKHPHMEVLQS